MHQRSSLFSIVNGEQPTAVRVALHHTLRPIVDQTCHGKQRNSTTYCTTGDKQKLPGDSLNAKEFLLLMNIEQINNLK